MLQVLQFLLFLTFGLGILYYVYYQQDIAFQAQCALEGKAKADCSLLGKIADDFRGANYWWISVVMLCFTISNWSRAVRWNMLIRELGYKPRTRNAFFAVMISYLTNLWLSRAGEVVRAGSLARYERIPTAKVMGTVIVDRILDMVCLMLIVVVGFILEFNTYWTYLQQNTTFTMGSVTHQWPYLVALVVLTVIGVAFYKLRDKFRHTKFYEKGRTLSLSLWEGFKTVKYVENPLYFILHSVNIWLMYFLMTYLCFKAYAPTSELGGLPALTVFVFGTFGMVIPSPGGMGTYHALVVAALAIYGINKIDAFSYANIIFFSIQIGCSVIMGIASVILLPIMNRGYTPEPVGKAIVPENVFDEILD